MWALGNMSTLAHEVARFREWALVRLSPDHRPDQYSSGALWECDYPDWQAIYAAVDGFVAEAAQRTITSEELELLLYVLARDNEDEHVLETLGQFPGTAAQVVEAAVCFSDVGARWQAAVIAGRIGAASTVRRFLDDPAEYVRRRAGFALQEMEDEKQLLCVSCMFPNEPPVHFCAKCGAPMSSYAATGPFESLFAEGHVYRQATERPRRLIVVLGIWIIFGMMAVAGVAMLFIGREVGLQYVVVGAFLLPISLVIIWKTTRNYFTRPRVEERRDA